MPLDSVPDILDDIREGKMVILMDDEDRENEGDLVIAAEKVTPEIINFFASEACGLICMPITAERARQLRISSTDQRPSVCPNSFGSSGSAN